MKRVFIPVGQGAFYTEKFGDFTMVYDCGTKKGKSFIEKVIKCNFRKDDVIDILFISHFHSDHINGVKFLKNHCQIKNVVLPFMYETMKIAILLEAKIRDKDFVSYLKEFLDFKNFFSGTNIFFVGEEEGESTAPDIDLVEIQNDQTEPQSIKNRQRFTPSKQSKWLFVPYNRENSTHKKELEAELNKTGKDFPVLEQMIISVTSKDKEFKEIKDIYNKIFKGKNDVINYNSMLVYSGPETDDFSFCGIFQNHPWYYEDLCYFQFSFCRCKRIEFKVGCIYTGDSSLENKLLQSVYQQYEKYVGTVQIPHHGSIESFDNSIFDFDFCFCPISFGVNNGYQHPSCLVVAELIENFRLPVFVTEKKDSVFVQTFNMR